MKHFRKLVRAFFISLSCAAVVYLTTAYNGETKVLDAVGAIIKLTLQVFAFIAVLYTLSVIVKKVRSK